MSPVCSSAEERWQTRPAHAPYTGSVAPAPGAYFIAAGLDWKQISTWAGHSDVRQTWNRYGHLVPGGEGEAADRLSAYLDRSTVAQTVAQPLRNAKSPVDTGLPEYRYRDSNPGFRRERAAS
jgi:hypothetical protein